MSGRTDPATGKPLPHGVSYRGPKQYMTRKVVDGRRSIRLSPLRRKPNAGSMKQPPK
ncbi:hypothetical protein [Acetobacter cerevisiae]|uniref:hypothetical protein n=1 Tax=Acetobacter cerevisiae TaxID=178900 RepID=UPI001E57AEE9|nr:hypothetical protein [Acetobacter cerevisiae]